MPDALNRPVHGTGTERMVRILQLLDLLHVHGELATRDLVVLLSTDRKKLMRDLRTLRGAGVPVHWVGRGRNRRHRLAPYYRRSRERGDEALALAIGRSVLESGTVPWTTVQGQDRPGAPRLLVVGAGPRIERSDTEQLDVLMGAIVFGRRLHLRVKSVTTPVAVVPYGLVSVAGYLLVVAYAQEDDGAPRWSSWRLDVLEIVDSDEPVADAPDNDRSEVPLSHALARSLGSERPPTVLLPVALRFDETVADVVRALHWPETTQFVDDTSTTLSVHTQLTVTGALDRVLSLGGGVSVHQPGFLRSAMRLATHGTTFVAAARNE